MRKTREVLRLGLGAGMTGRMIGRSLNIGYGTVYDYLSRARAANLTWPLPEEIDDAALERLLFPKKVSPEDARPVPDWAVVHLELRRHKYVTLQLLWEEYKQLHPDGFQRSRYCDLYRGWLGKVDLVMRQDHRAGEKLFVDYAGPTVSIVEMKTGEIQFEAQIFVAVMGASNYAYAEATRTQTLPDWIGAHVRAIEFFGGVPEIIVPDNLKSGVSKTCRYEPDINPTYLAWAQHYETAIIPARVAKPKDKAKAEGGVLLVERWILAALRNRIFTRLAELNGAIRELLTRLNNRPFQKLPGTRSSQFDALDRPALRPLPATKYTFEEWSYARAGIDYHVEVDGHFYSVPYALVKKRLDVRATRDTVEVFFGGKRIAAHLRNHNAGRHTTDPSHMPSSHRKYAEWTPQRILRWAESTGPETALFIGTLMEHRSHPEQGFRSAMGVMQMGKKFGPERLEAACKRASHFRTYSYKSVATILRTGAAEPVNKNETLRVRI